MQKSAAITYSEGRRIVKGEKYYRSDDIQDLREVVKGAAQKYGNRYAFRFKDKSGNITGKTYEELESDVDALGTALINMGLKEARIAIIGENRYEWAVSYLSVVNGVGIAVPLDKHLPVNEVEALIIRSRAEAIFYSPSYQAMAEDLIHRAPSIRYYISMENKAMKTAKTSPPSPILLKRVKICWIRETALL